MNLQMEKRIPSCKITKKTVKRSVANFNRWHKVVQKEYDAKRKNKHLLSRKESSCGIEILIENHKLIKKRFDRAIENYQRDVMTSEDVNVIFNSVNLYQEKKVQVIKKRGFRWKKMKSNL